MPLGQIPAINANICSGWTEQDINLYNRLDYYLAKMQVDRRPEFTVWSRFLGKRKWTPNMGSTMRSVSKEPSPHIRQFAFPNEITTAPKKDVVDIRERRVDEQVYRHRFESLIMSYVSSFRDFLTDHVDATGDDIMEKMERFEDIFYRGRIFHNSPHVWLAGHSPETDVAPMGLGNDAGTDGKTSAYLQQAVAKIGDVTPGYLSFETLNKLVTVLENDIGALPFKGSALPKQDQGMSNQFCLVLSSEAFNQFTFDPWLLANKNCQLDIVNDRFRGSIFGRITTLIEKNPLRVAIDGTFPAPEIRVGGNIAAGGPIAASGIGNTEVYNLNESIPNPSYTSMDDQTGCPYEVAFLVGAQAYEVIDVGPPPSQFASNGMPKGFGKMFWNGEVQITKNIMIPCIDSQGNTQWVPNQYGEYLQFISQVTYGMLGKQKRWIVPILFKRKRGK